MESKAGKTRAAAENVSEKRLLRSGPACTHLSRGKPEDASKTLRNTRQPRFESRRRMVSLHLAMLYAVGGTPADRKRAIELIRMLPTLARSVEEPRRDPTSLVISKRSSCHFDARARRSTPHTRLGSLLRIFYNLSHYRRRQSRPESRRCLQLLLNAEPENIYYLVAALEESVDNQEIAQARTFAEKLMRHHTGEFRAMAAVARYECRAGSPETALAVAERYAQNADPAAGDHLTRSGRVAELLDELARPPNVRVTPAGHAVADAAVERTVRCRESAGSDYRRCWHPRIRRPRD